MKQTILYLFIITSFSGYSQSLLTFQLSSNGNDINIEVENDINEKHSIILLEGKTRLINDFNEIYWIIDNLKKSKIKKLDFKIDSLSRILITPFESLMSKCNRIRFIVEPELLKCTFDLLKFNDVPLFLQFEIVYCLQKTDFKNELLTISKGLIISDSTADPEDGCSYAHKLFPKTEYFRVEDASDELIEKQRDIDFILISAHGAVDDEFMGGIYISEKQLNANVFSKTNPQLVYIDACQQGINLSYIQALKNNGRTRFYIAPIISNDAGDSSTKTIQWFFIKLKSSKDTVTALSFAKRKLYSYYSYNTTYNKIKILNKSFPFRIYQIL